MTAKKGVLKLVFSGPSVTAGPSLYVEYGTWHIAGATGAYKQWKGGGNCGGTDDEQTYHIQKPRRWPLLPPDLTGIALRSNAGTDHGRDRLARTGDLRNVTANYGREA